jgi:25S rRNA (adenine2142-N1)-methyltransferase
MASEEHLKMSTCIKNVHATLRALSKTHGPEAAWQVHLNNHTQLSQYSSSMKTLANEHWKETSNETSGNCRITWTVTFCNDYFKADKQNGILKFREKDMLILKQMNDELEYSDAPLLDDRERLKLLDVGSCYNPFAKYNSFDVTAVDIAPAESSGVLQSDFLNVNLLAAENSISLNHSKLKGIPKTYFDVVVFSLLLEYLPSPNQRHKCCANAYQVLKSEGLLIIITPDSKHQSANSRLMKNWRYILGRLGFARIKYEKLKHITCMAFRKSLNKVVAERWSNLHKEAYMTEELHIPQDFNNEEEIGESLKESVVKEDPRDIKNLFFELPDCET